MTIDTIRGKWEIFFSEIRTRLDKHNDNQLTRDGIKRKEFVETFQERYGYTKEKAEAEMSEHYSEIILG